MDDLISRKAAIEAARIPNGAYDPLDRHGIIIARVEACRRIRELSSVPAVPLDKLCEWLGKVAILRCCECTSNYCDGKECSSSNHFDKEIKKWMEEQDAAN